MQNFFQRNLFHQLFNVIFIIFLYFSFFFSFLISSSVHARNPPSIQLKSLELQQAFETVMKV